MNTHVVRVGILLASLLFVAMLATAPAGAQPFEQDDLIERGHYLAEIAGCLGCHTPINPETGTPNLEMLGAGGQPFDLGPLGVVVSKNLTSDPETGLGDWTDEEIKTAITTGVSPDGLHLFPIMPYRYFNNMADEDLDAIVAYLRSLPPIENAVPREQILPPEVLPQLTRQEGIVAPDPADTEARANYLFTAVLACSECHTPLDPETQAPIMDMYMAGGQPYEGPWGIVYGANITPHEETGIGTWSDQDIERVMRTGIRPDGRHVVLMPWPEYAPMTAEDMDAVIYYLRNEVAPVENEVPAPQLEEGWEEYTDLPTMAEPELSNDPTLTAIGMVVTLAVIVGAVAILWMTERRRRVD